MRVTLLDGGVGQEIVRRAPGDPTGLWSTAALISRPGLVAEVHRDFLAAGATVLTANTYALHEDRLAGTDWQGRAGDLARAALAAVEIARAGRSIIRVAGSVGPLVWSYRAHGLPPYDEARRLYAGHTRRIAEGCDFILIETAPSVEQARAALDGARDATDLPVWLAVTVDDEDGTRLRSGEEVAALETLAPDAWLANCSAPEAMPAALGVLGGFGRPFGAYANGFERITKEYLAPGSTVSALSGRRDMGPETYAGHVMAWVGDGATIVGGCCEIGPAHIAEIARRLAAAGHEIV